MPEHDVLIAEAKAELEDHQAFIDQLLEGARGRDLNATEEELMMKKTDRMAQVGERLEKLTEVQKISIQSRQRIGEIVKAQTVTRPGGGPPSPIEYRSAGVWVADWYTAMRGDQAAQERIDLYQRAAAHQTTADNPGLIPERISEPIINFVNFSRPIVSTVGPTDLGTGAWVYATITQHTQVAKQTAEKAELASRKMTITKTPLAPDTYGGYLNVSRQDISRTSPGIVDQVINDLAGQYAIATEAAAGTVMTTAAQTGPVIPATPTAANIATALYGAVGSVFAATQGQGRTVIAMSPDQLGILAPLFPFVNPQNAFSTGFGAEPNFGVNGTIGGVSVIMSAGLATDTILVFSTAAVRMFEDRYGAMQVVEPSVAGVQVGYNGDFQTVVVLPTGIVRVTTA